MCGIVGILSKSDRNVTPLIGTMLSCMKNRGPDGMGLATENQILYSDTFDNVLFSKVDGHAVLGHSRLAIVGGPCGSSLLLVVIKSFCLSTMEKYIIIKKSEKTFRQYNIVFLLLLTAKLLFIF